MNTSDVLKSAHYVVNQNGERVAVQLSMEAWQAVLSLLGQSETASPTEQPHTTEAHKPPAKPSGPLRFGEVQARFDPEEYAERRD
jgi:hypothetical protein